MKPCALCKSAAKVYCDSDQASLCWTCDSKVHSANFLVARHSRSLLCRVCRSPTPWTASGEKIGPAAFSICEKCVVDGTSDGEESEGENHDDEDDDEYDGDEDDETELDVDDEDDGDDDFQVVPLSFTPPPAASSSSDDDSVGDRSGLSKRKRENVSDLSEDEFYGLSMEKNRSAVDHDSREAVNGYAIGEEREKNRHRDKISGEKKSGAVTGGFNGTSTVGLNLNLYPSDS